MKLLNGEHVISGDEYFRQRHFCPYDSDSYAKSTFVSLWAPIRYLVGYVWKGKKLKELDHHDEHYPYEYSFLRKYEFVNFENEEEKKLTEIYSDREMKNINEMFTGCFRTWKDWPEFYLAHATKDELDYVINTPVNVCPHCGKGVIIRKHGIYGDFNGCTNFPACKYVEDHTLDSYGEYRKRYDELTILKKTLEKL